MSLQFSTATLESLQTLLFPLVKMLTGFDTQEWTGDQSELFVKVGEAFGDVSQLFLVAGTALEDGFLSEEEIGSIVAKAKTLPEAIEEIIGFFSSEEELPENPS